MKCPPARLLIALAIPLTLAAATNPAVYQDGVLTKVRTTVVGNSCSDSTQSDAATYGNTARRTFDASARCSDVHGAVYTIEVAGKEYELTPDHSRAARASAYLPLTQPSLSKAAWQTTSPAQRSSFRRDGEDILVLVVKRESHYRIFVAH